MALASPATWGLQKGQISDRSLSLSFAKTCFAPNTYEAMEVPEILLVAWSDPIQTLVISRPGAKTSTHLPKFEKLARSSVMVEAPTVMASSLAAGE